MTKISVIERRGERILPNFSVPFHCPRCEEIRNVDPETEATGLNTPHESLMWNSFQMCSLCYRLSKDHPEQVEANKKLYQERLAKKEQQIETEVKAKRFRVWIRGDYHKYVEFVVDKPFFGWEEKGGHKCKVLVSQEVANEMVNKIQSKNIECWVEEETV